MCLIIADRQIKLIDHIVTTLTDELDKLRENICYNCKKKLVPGSFSASPGRTDASPSTSDPPRIESSDSSSNPAIDSSIPGILITSETIPGATSDAPVIDPSGKLTPISSESEPDSELPEFSVEYNPEVKRTLALHLEHVFAHASPAFPVKINPDGQRMAVGFEDSGATIISDTKTRSNVRSVSECLVSNLD